MHKQLSILKLNYNEKLERIKTTHIFVNSRTGLRFKKYINLHLKLRKNKNYHENKTAHWHIATSFFLKQHFFQASNIS